MKIFVIIGLVLIIASCNNARKMHGYDNTLEAEKITETNIRVEVDSFGHEIFDTLSVSEKLYDTDNKLIKRKIEYSIEDQWVIDYKYNELGLLDQEIIWMSDDSSKIIVDYNYQDSVLKSTTSNSEVDGIVASLEAEYLYHSNGERKEIRSNYVLIIAGDTTSKQEIESFSKSGLIMKHEIINYSDSIKREYTIFKHKDNLLTQSKDYDNNSLLVLTSNYTYKLDSLGNWIERITTENDTLTFRCYRRIQYR